MQRDNFSTRSGFPVPALVIMFLLGCALFAFTGTCSAAGGSAQSPCDMLLQVSLTKFEYVQDLFFGLWKSAGFGFYTFERSAFLIWDENGFSIQDWGMTVNKMRCQMFIGIIPRGSVAIVHTHPNGCSPYPSVVDQKTADSLNLVMFVLSRKGITCYDPFSKRMIKLEEGSIWTNIIKRQKRGSTHLPLIADVSTTDQHHN